MTLPTQQGDRRQVSVLFTDMVGYTAVVENLGEERAAGFTQMIYDILARVVRDAGGTVRSFAGDSIMAVFGIPEALEDAALRACRTALAIHAAFETSADAIATKFEVRPKMRVGISSGAAVMASLQGEGSELTVVGKTVNLASRIQALAPEGGCLICDVTRDQAEELITAEIHGNHELKGITGVQRLWSLLSIRKGATRFDASLARGLSEYVGRDTELAAMSAALQEAQTGRRVVDLVAEPGLGKTRLVYEFLNNVDEKEAVVLSGQCSVDGQQVPFFPFLEVLRSTFRISDKDGPEQILTNLTKGLQVAQLYSDENLGLLANMLGLSPPPGALDGLDGVLIGLRTRDLLPSLLAAQCRAVLVILQIEDAHWIDSASEELLQTLIDNDNLSNLLIVQTHRPEYAPIWRDSPVVSQLALRPLSEGNIRLIAQKRLGVDELPDALVQQIADKAGGNPLFGEEILAFLIQQGAVQVTDGEVNIDVALGDSGLPASMQGLLTAKFDRLREDEQILLQAAAAIGRRFDPALLAAVLGARVPVERTLQELQAQDVVYRDANARDYIFKHVLLRDTVYQSLLSGPKSELHLAIAHALEARNEGRLSEVAETLAFHYALTDQCELAFRYAVAAGTKGLGVFSLEEANRSYEAAMERYEGDPSCVEPAEFAAFLADYALCSNISLRVNTMLELADKVAPFWASFGDSRHYVHFLHHYISCLIWNARYIDAGSVQEELTALAGRLGDPECQAYALVSELALSCYSGTMPSEVFEAKQKETETIFEELKDAYLENYFLANVGWNAVCRGRVQQARAAAEQMIKVGHSNNDPRSLGYGTSMKALIALASDDFKQAFEIAEQARELSRVQFEITISQAARYGSIIALEKPGAAQEVQRFVDDCNARGLILFMSTTNTMLGVAMVLDGRIDQGLRHIEANIKLRDDEGYHIAADWYRMFLCEIYLEILSGEGEASLGMMLRNFRALSKVILFGGKRIEALTNHIRGNPMFDPDGHQIARVEMLTGLLYKVKKKKDLAHKHLSAAHRIVAPAGPSTMLTRIETALEQVTP